MTKQSQGTIYGLIGIFAFGLTLPATKVIMPYLDPIFVGLGRAVMAAFLAAFFLIIYRAPFPNKEQVTQLVFVALGVVIGFPVFSSLAMLYVPASHGAVVFGILPLATAIAAVIVTNEKPSPAFWLVSIVGCILVVIYALRQNTDGFHIADLMLFGAIISAAMGYAVGAKLSNDIGGWQTICWALIIALPFTLIPAFLYAPDNYQNYPATVYMNFLYLSLVSQLFAFFAWYKGLALGGIARISQLQLLQPFITIIAAALFIGEIIDTNTLIFALLVVSTVWLGKKMPID